MEVNISYIDIAVILLFVVGIIWWALKTERTGMPASIFWPGNLKTGLW